MTDVPAPDARSAPDADLIEYVRISASSVADLEQSVTAVADLVRSGVIRLIDVALLNRQGDHPSVRIRECSEVDALTELAAVDEGLVRLSEHDLALISITVAPDTASLVLLIEDRWASSLSSAARRSGGRLVGGERVGREAFVEALRQAQPEVLRVASGDLVRATPAVEPPGLAIDPAAQLRTLAGLVARGILSDEQYEAQRRRVAGA